MCKFIKKIWALFLSVCETLVSQIVPQLWVWKLHHVLNRKLNSIDKPSPIYESTNSDDDDSLVEILEQDHEAEKDRRSSLVEKARAGLFIIGIVIAATMGGVKFLDDRQLSNLTYVVLLAGTFSFAMSAFCLTKAVSLVPWYGTYLDDILGVGGGKLFHKKISVVTAIETFYRHGKLNQIGTTQIGNLVTASYTGIRNGVLLFLVFLILALAEHPAPLQTEIRPAIIVGDGRSITQTIEAQQDAIERVVVPQEPTIKLVDPFDSKSIQNVEAGMIIYYKDGTFQIISARQASELLEAGTLSSLGVTIELKNYL